MTTRGSSGAVITVDADRGVVIKRDGAAGRRQARAQGEWLVDRGVAHPDWTSLPRVFRLLPDGYEMELLYAPELAAVHPRLAVGAIIEALAGELWRTSPIQAGVDRAGHRDYVAGLLRDVGRTDLVPFVDDVGRRIRWGSLYRCLTHGDCIIDNMTMRGSEVVVLDPIPATPALPDVLASDVGRLIQSGIGYEAVRYVDVPRVRAHDVARQAYAAARVEFSDAEYTACLYTAVVHMLRGLRTARRLNLPGAPQLDHLVNYLVGEVQSWMR